jgi:hypothetical protein
MVNNNNNIPIEVNKKPFEIVQEVKNEIPSYEEFMKNYKTDKEVVDGYNGEFEGYGDIRVKGTYYGPGFWDDIKGVVKPITSGVLIAASLFPPTAAIAAPVAFSVVGAGAAVSGLGHITDNKDLKDFGRDIAEIGIGARDGQEVTETPMGVRQGSMNEYARSRR